MKHTFFFLLAVISLNSCKKLETTNNSPDTIYKFDSIQRGNLTGWINFTTLPFLGSTTQAFHYEYIGDRFSLRVGGFGRLCSAANCTYLFDQVIYDTVIYGSNNTIRVIARSSDPVHYRMTPDTNDFVVLHNKPQTKIHHNYLSGNYDTTFFFYSANQKLERTIENSHATAYQKTYDYSSSGNLEKISGRITNRYTGDLIYTSEETFSNYDSTGNPLKSYWLWEESFTRSLSENNFRSYHYSKVYVGSGAVVEWANKIWNFQYRNGVADFSK